MGVVTIEYHGDKSREVAIEISKELEEENGFTVEKSPEIQLRATHLGMEQLVLTILLANLTLRVVESLLKRLKAYFAQQAGLEAGIDIQIVIKASGPGNTRRFPFRLSQATGAILDSVFESIKKAVSEMLDERAGN